MPSIIEEMLELYREEMRMRRLENQVQATPPEQIESYIAETAEWDKAYDW